MRYGPVKRLDRHEELHQKVKGLFSAFTLFTLYAFLCGRGGSTRDVLKLLCSRHGRPFLALDSGLP